MVPDNCIVGKFLSEDKNRFRCTVEIDGGQESCYVASSCRLDNFIKLKNKTVLLKPNLGKKLTTSYSVLGVKHKKSYILLNTSAANQAVDNSFFSRKLACIGKRHSKLREHMIEGYKSDFYVPNSKTVVEVKSIISIQDKAVFPTVYSERMLKQLLKIEELLQKGYSARLLIVSLNPYVKRVELNLRCEFYEALIKCISCGLQIAAFTCRIASDGTVFIDKKIPIST